MNWQDKQISLGDLLLDERNPRIQIHENPSQVELFNYLLKNEDVLELCRSIKSAGGLFPNERIIVTKLGGKYVVLEGNRRLCACLALKGKFDVPHNVQRSLPALPEQVVQTLDKLAASVAPSREAANPVIAKLHSFSSRKSWKPIAKMRYAWSLFEDNVDVDAIADGIGETPSSIRKMIRRYAIYRRVLGLDWEAQEREVLESDKVPITPITRLFELSAAKNTIGDVFSPTGDYVGQLDESDFDEKLQKMARDFMLPELGQNKPKFNTRTDAAEYLKDNFPAVVQAYQKSKPPEGADSGKIVKFPSSPPSPAASPPPTAPPPPSPPTLPSRRRFFDGIEIKFVNGGRLYDFVRELVVIRRDSCPNASALLIRSSLETALWAFVEAKNRRSDVQAAVQRQVTLELLLGWAADQKNGLFVDQSIRRACARIQNQHITDLNQVAHSSRFSMSPAGMYAVADAARPIIEYVVSDAEGLA